MEEAIQTVVIPPPPKSAIDSKTIWFGIAVAAAGLLEIAEWMTNENLIPAGPALTIVGVLIVVLRFITKRPVTLAGGK